VQAGFAAGTAQEPLARAHGQAVESARAGLIVVLVQGVFVFRDSASFFVDKNNVLYYKAVHMAEEKRESIWKFYFQSRWQTALAAHYLIAVAYLVIFYVNNLFVAFKFAFFTFSTSARQLGLEFALWGVVFMITVLVPFFTSWYAIFLLPNIWRSDYGKWQKSALTILMVAVFGSIIIIADTLARYALETGVLREFAHIHDIRL